MSKTFHEFSSCGQIIRTISLERKHRHKENCTLKAVFFDLQNLYNSCIY